MKKIILTLFLGATLGSQAQTVVSVTPLDTISQALLNFFAGGLAQNDVASFKITYNTVDEAGLPTVASGAFSVPVNANCDSLSIVSYAHGTVLNKDDVPSRNNFEATLGKVAASRGYVAVMPDYIGLGDNPGFHPYLHAESQATATLDIIRATREYLEDSLSGYDLNNDLFFTGYSQGGHACMAAVKYIQDNNLEGEFNITAAGPASGPYDLAGTTALSIVQDVPYSNPGYVVYLLYAMNEVYGNIFNSPADILKAPYETQVPPLMLGQNDLADLNAILPSKVSQFLEDTVLQAFIADTIGQTHPIWQALKANTIYDWTPNFPMRLYYCTQDEQVNFENSVLTESTMNANGATNVIAVNGGPLDHGGCVLPSVSAGALFFDSLSTSCGRGPIGLVEEGFSAFTLYPNPATNQIRFEGLPENEQLSGMVFNSTGQNVYRFTVKGQQPVSVGHLKAGLYIVNLGHKGQSINLRLLIE
jgi:hypothetical protein